MHATQKSCICVVKALEKGHAGLFLTKAVIVYKKNVIASFNMLWITKERESILPCLQRRAPDPIPVVSRPC